MQIHGKEIKTIISDLDGTLLGEGTKLDEAVFPIIKELEERGIRFVAASGRQYNNMKLLFAPILEGMSFVCENGSQIIKDGETIYEKNIPRDLSFELLADLTAVSGAETTVSSERGLYTLAGRKSFVEHVKNFFHPAIQLIESYRDITGNMNKISIWWKDGIPKEEELRLHKKYDDRLQVVDGGNGWLDFTMKGVNKGTALLELARIEGFSLKEALCFGDSENDVAMFRECGISYAMETGREHVKEEADYVCTNVMDVLQNFLKK